MRVCVCGGRKYDDVPRIWWELGEIHKRDCITFMATGGQQHYDYEMHRIVGADYWAREWAVGRAIRFVTYEAEWGSRGRAAGPIRNTYMLDDFKPDLVVAFPGSNGTDDTVRKADARGIRVVRIKHITGRGYDPLTDDPRLA